MSNNAISSSIEIVQDDKIAIKNLIYLIRNQQVMLDSDLAALYQVETMVLNQAVKRNIARFPENYRFQLTKEEYEILISQFVISKKVDGKDGRGGRRTLPYVFTEQGIAMLSSVLRSDTAITVSLRIMDSFVEMRRFIMTNSLLFEQIKSVEFRQLEYEKKTDANFEKVFDYISSHEESNQKVFFDGQIYDAFSLIASLIKKADNEILLIDNYVDLVTLNLLSKKNSCVPVNIYTHRNTQLNNIDIANFNKQYPLLTVNYTSVFHDRFLILDSKIAYHIGASIKDAGKKCFGISLIHDTNIIKDILSRLFG
jgi:hypothetical protein